MDQIDDRLKQLSGVRLYPSKGVLAQLIFLTVPSIEIPWGL
jgi:hypothetical protein